MSNNYPPNQPPPGGSYPPPAGPYSTTPLPGGYPQDPPVVNYAPGGGPPPKKKAGPLFYVLGGCGAIILIGVIIFAVGSYLVYNKAKRLAKDSGIDSELIQKKPALAAAKAVVAMNPDLVLVSTDDEKGLITVRNKKTGETITINADDANKGKLSFRKDGKDVGSVELHSDNGSGSLEFKSDEGNAKIGAGVSDTAPGWLPVYPGAAPQWDFTTQNKDGHAGNFHFMTSDSAEKIASFYEDAFNRVGFKMTTTTSGTSQVKTIFLTAQDDVENRSAFITVAPDSNSGNRVNVVFKSTP
jgi:hypothetical protein